MANKLNLIGRFQHWMDTHTGQMFLNYAYSWGASIVILGALFKLTHIAGANLMLFIGMGTEVIVFFLSGFERPWEDDGKPEVADTEIPEGEEGENHEEVAINGLGGGTIVINGNGGYYAGNGHDTTAASDTEVQATDADHVGTSSDEVAAMVQPTPAGLTPEMQEATTAYVEQLNELTETLKKVTEQSARLTRDSEEMESMNRTLTGINRFYEMQLRSVGQQSGSLDSVNEQTKLLAQKLEELNDVYARMVEALKTRIN